MLFILFFLLLSAAKVLTQSVNFSRGALSFLTDPKLTSSNLLVSFRFLFHKRHGSEVVIASGS